MNRKLKIYKASAGSGKTFTLALEYIKLLVDNPSIYRNILAVTFTNKATGEMKERILSKLYGVAYMLPDSNDYLDKLLECMPEKSKEEIAKRARLALRLILHDYGHFRIQTIDAFFQSVLRGLAKELDLNGDMEISLDGKELLNNAVDTYIRQLEPNTKNISQIIRYIDETLEKGGDWHVDKEIKKFATNILEEEYQERGEELRQQIDEENGKILTDFREKVTKREAEVLDEIKALGENFFILTTGYTVEDFALKSKGVWGFFDKLRNGSLPAFSPTIKGMISNPDKISSKYPNCADIVVMFKKYETLIGEYTSCKLSMSHYHQLGMLNNIAKTLKDENARENRFLLSDTTHLLSTMINNNTSFIFEKIGTEIEHIFIDEFQDTSKLQWECFQVLLKEIISRGRFNLIVGDVKQSIYRWRNGDWKIMNNIGSYFKEYGNILEFESPKATIEGKEYQSVNYRSDRRIIAFNNALFRSAIEVISTTYKDDLGQEKLNEIINAYNDVEQAYPIPRNGKPEKPEQGYVEARIINKDKNVTQSELYKHIIDKLMGTLHTLMEEQGVAPKDIAILLRTNDNIDGIVEAFKREFPTRKIVSEEAYRLSSSLTVSLAVAAMRYIATPEDKVNIANMLNLYNKVILKNDDPLEAYVSRGDLIELLPAEFRNDLDHLKGLPPYELIEQLLTMLNIDESKGEEAYIYAFLDHASHYINSKGADLPTLLAAWDDGLCDKCIPAESLDCIKIMTIHKSKGLEFHTVIIPFCDWKLTADSRNLLWCKPQTEPFKALSLLPIKSKEEMKKSVFSEDYHKEFMYQIVDNLNILYVATTRAKSNLIIFSEKHETKSYYVWKLFNDSIMNLPKMKDATLTLNEQEDVYTYGEVVASKEKRMEKKEKNEKEKNPFDTPSETEEQPFSFYDNRLEVKQSRELRRFLASDEEKKALKNIAEGELMHLVMSRIERSDDIDNALNKLMMEGFIDNVKQYEKIKKLVEKALANPIAKEWFNGTYRLYNECTILSRKQNLIRRPDRVMIKGNEAVVVDYKFGRKNEGHDEQVLKYIELLTDMKYENVKGYLWYVYRNEIKPVK